MESLKAEFTGSRRHPCSWGLYAILDTMTGGGSLEETAGRVLAGGAKVIQLRDKVATFEELLEAGRMLRAMTRASGAALIVNDNPYLAREIEADGVHIGQSDCPVDIAREVVGPDKIVGLSTHTKSQILAARFLPVSYIGIGPVYPTTSKVTDSAVVGPQLLKWGQENSTVPVVAIGGITRERIPEVIATGVANAAMIHEIVSASDPELRTREVVALIAAAKQSASPDK